MEYVRNFSRFLLDNGLIFEINRKVLHPIGLAFIIDMDEDNEKKAVLSLIAVDDEDGILFGEESLDEGYKKYNKFLRDGGQERLNCRQKTNGFIVQEK